jgi:hypothetical protein
MFDLLFTYPTVLRRRYAFPSKAVRVSVGGNRLAPRPPAECGGAGRKRLRGYGPLTA